jgi:hypothetical protein
MKLSIRVIAFTFVVAAAIVGNSLPKNATLAAMHRATVPGPVPTCNPFTQPCPNIR